MELWLAVVVAVWPKASKLSLFHCWHPSQRGNK